MDADVVIMIEFCLAVLLFACARALFVAHESRKGRSEAVVETGCARQELPVACGRKEAVSLGRVKTMRGWALAGSQRSQPDSSSPWSPE
jgi:GDP-D-mannose dehydratase